jgi:serine/threonine-protein kinase HipA
VADRVIEVTASIGSEDVLAGRLYSHRRADRESASFEYETSYLSRPEAYALDPTLPLVQGGLQTPVGLKMFRAFADSAPDRWGRALITRAERRGAAAQAGTTRTLGEIDFLLGVRDDLRQGAVRFREPGSGQYLADVHSGVPQLSDLGRLLLAAEHVIDNEETAQELKDLIRGGSSLGGARPKAHVIDEGGRIAIAKFPSRRVDDWDVEAWERVALALAEQAGIRVPRSRLIRIEDRNVLVVDRFDREGDSRIGYVSAMTMLEATDGDTGSYIDIGDVIERHSPRATEDLTELWRRMAFNVVISNTDDHLRNHGFVHAGGSSWSLAPAFDLNPVPSMGRRYLSTSIDGSDRAASVALLMSVAEYFRLDESRAIGVLGDVVGAASRWRTVAMSEGIPASEIEVMAPAFEHDEALVAAQLARSVSGTG